MPIGRTFSLFHRGGISSYVTKLEMSITVLTFRFRVAKRQSLTVGQIPFPHSHCLWHWRPDNSPSRQGAMQRSVSHYPDNRYTWKARSEDACATVGCCWDENAQHCYKEACKYKQQTSKLYIYRKKFEKTPNKKSLKNRATLLTSKRNSFGT